MLRRRLIVLPAVFILACLIIGAYGPAAAADKSALSYDETIDWSVGKDGSTTVFLRAAGNVGITSEGIGMHEAPDRSQMYIDMSPGNATINHVPEGAEIKRAFLYWGGNFGTDGRSIPGRDQAPAGSGEITFEGTPLTGWRDEGGDVDQVGYEMMNGVNHRRLYRAEVTDLIGDEPNRMYHVETGPLSLLPLKAWWGASLVIVFTHQSITMGEVCIADGCNIMDSHHQASCSAMDFTTRPTLPSAYKGILTSEGHAPDTMSYDFRSYDEWGNRNAPDFHQDDVCEDTDGNSWDDRTYPLAGHVATDTARYSVDLVNTDDDGYYADFYFDWFWFAAMVDFNIEKSGRLAVDRDGDGLISPGDTLEYTVSFENRGQTAANQVAVMDDYDESLVESVTGITDGGSVIDGGKVRWQVGRLEGGSATSEFSYRLTLKAQDQFPRFGDVLLINIAEIKDEQTGYYKTASDTQTVVNNPELPDTAQNWYFAEGSTGADARGSFETWIVLQNPGNQSAQAVITYMTPGGEVAGPPVPPLEPGTRQTYSVGDTVPDEWSVSTHVTSDVPIAAERAQYWHGADGGYREAAHDSIGVNAGASDWYFAEGSTGSDSRGSFETWITLQNPGAVTALPVMTYMTPEGEVAGPAVPPLEPGTRQTFSVGDTVPGEWSVSTRVSSTVPIVAERAVYWHGSGGAYRQAAHDSIGVTAGATDWYFAEGSAGSDGHGSFETWITVQNPGTETANVNIESATRHIVPPLEPGTRQTYNVGIAGEWSFSTHVASDVPIVAERSVYWHSSDGTYRQAAHGSIGATAGAVEWCFAEGSTGSGTFGSFETWITIFNAGTEVANPLITYMTLEGSVPGPPLPPLEPGGRQTLSVADTLPGEWSVSTLVTSDAPVIAERAMYWHGADGTYRQAAHASLGVSGTD